MHRGGFYLILTISCSDNLVQVLLNPFFEIIFFVLFEDYKVFVLVFPYPEQCLVIWSDIIFEIFSWIELGCKRTFLVTCPVHGILDNPLTWSHSKFSYSFANFWSSSEHLFLHFFLFFLTLDVLLLNFSWKRLPIVQEPFPPVCSQVDFGHLINENLHSFAISFQGLHQHRNVWLLLFKDFGEFCNCSEVCDWFL